MDVSWPLVGRRTELAALTALGIGRTFQNIRLFGTMSALDNVLVGQHVEDARAHLDRALEYERQPPNEAWDAVEVFKKK